MDYFTKNGQKIVIEKGGEQLPNNTYGFEIEFCTHDSSVFTFTHVDVAKLNITFPDTPQRPQEEWTLETDSGNVFELVTSPLVFATTQLAYQAKDALANLLTTSVSAAQIGPAVVNAVSYATWTQQALQPLTQITGAIYGSTTLVQNVERSWQQVGTQLTLENVDDGINIKAALLRYQMNPDGAWLPYVYGTVLCRSEKDWGVGYSSQVNMPMTLEGYFLYVVTKKLPRADVKLQQIISVTALDEVGDSTLQQRVVTWFWRRIIVGVTNKYASRLFGVNVDIRNLQVSETTSAQLKWLGLMYVTANKILTGALGALSEPNQLKLQIIAWNQKSTEAMVADSPASREELVRSANIDTLDWLEYHSALKDLTGLWFKAALMDVVSKEVLLGVDGFQRMAQVLRDDHGAAWAQVLQEAVTFMKSDDWRKLWRRREGYVDDLETLDWRELLQKIVPIEQALAADIQQFANWLQHPDAPREAYFNLPLKAQRPFLHYASAPPWEGRYDTMVPAIRRPDGAWTYLIEHRFH